jgi:hypothetical protein
MNKDQKKIILYSLYTLSIILIMIFWRVGSQYDYSSSLLILDLGKSEPPYFMLPDGVYGVRLRMGFLGVLFGAIAPVVLVCAAAFIAKSDDS